MPRKLCDLKDVFVIEGRGVIFVLPKDDEWGISGQEKIHRHKCIRVLDSNGNRLDTFVKDLDFTVRNGGKDSDLCFTLPRDVTIDKISLPGEIWLERDGDTPVLWEGSFRLPELSQAKPPIRQLS